MPLAGRRRFMPLMFGSYEVSDADALVAALDFDETCLANYDFAGLSAYDGVDVTDIGRLIGSQMVGMAQSEAAALIAGSPGAPWHKVPIDARLEEAAPGTPLFAAAMELYDYFQAIAGIGPAKATKLLAMKRPALFAVIDSRVVELYVVAAAQQVGVSHQTTAAVREDVSSPATRAALDALRAALLTNGTPKALRLAQLTGLRLRDIVLWQRYEAVGAPRVVPTWPQVVPW
jgi:hypothetical protein